MTTRGGSRSAPASSGNVPRRSKSRIVTSLLGLVSASLKRSGVAPGSTILVGLSGGPDSVALLDALDTLRPSLQLRLAAAHLDHGLRGAESKRDATFVRKLCDRRGIDLTVGRARGLTPAMPNLEEHAREQRHRFMYRIADRIGADYIALAHHADDQAETVLMRLLRGAGASGLAAMAESGPSRLIRPLLGARRSAIMAYLRATGAEWVSDSSNDSTDLLRNRLRLELLPTLERDYAPGLSHRLTELAAEMRGLDRFITDLAQASLTERISADRLSLQGFCDLDPLLATAIVKEYLRRQMGALRQISRDHLTALHDLCHGTKPSGSINLPGGWRARREYDALVVAQTDPLQWSPFTFKLKRSGPTIIKTIGFRFEAKSFAREDPRCPSPAKLTPLEALFDANALDDALMVRNVHRSDRLEPLGMRGTRKVQDIFVDRKLARSLRERWPLVTSDGVIVWIPGMVRSRHALITPQTGKIQYLRAFLPPGCELTSVA